MESMQPDELETRVATQVLNRSMEPVIKLLRGTRRIGLFFTLILLVLLTVLQYELMSSNTRRNQSFTKLEKALIDTQRAANEARLAAQKASDDLATAIKASQGAAVSAQAVQHTFSQINCIAHQAYPCP